MLSWLRSVRPLLASLPGPEVTVVLGNMACDLDSGVSSLVLAHHRAVSSPGHLNIIPVLNIPSQDFPLKTELVAALAEENIHAEHLIFRDQLDLASIENLKLILVDHNILADQDSQLDGKVVEIIDHHVRETSHTNCIIEPVGSCSSLVLRKICQENPAFDDLCSLRLIHKTILLDTVELRPEAKKVTEVDVEMVEKCESILGNVNRHEIYNTLKEERSRVNHLNATQLLRRDFKTLSDQNIKVCLSSVPMLAKSWSELPEVESHLGTFLAQGGFTVLLVLGSVITADQIRKDLILTGDDQCPQFTAIVEALQSNSTTNLELERDKSVTKMLRFSQGNTGASRKQIMPIVKSALCPSQSSQ